MIDPSIKIKIQLYSDKLGPEATNQVGAFVLIYRFLKLPVNIKAVSYVNLEPNRSHCSRRIIYSKTTALLKNL